MKVYDSAQDGVFIARLAQLPADDPGRSAAPFNAEDVPHGKQEWYVNAGGIWQDVKPLRSRAAGLSTYGSQPTFTQAGYG